MKIKRPKKSTKNMRAQMVFPFVARSFLTSVVLFLFFGLSSCKPAAERLYADANAEIKKGHYRIALDLLERSSEIAKDSNIKYRYLSEAGRLARFEIQDYERAIRIYRRIILQSEDVEQRLRAQEAISEIYLENLQNYNMALKELQILEPLLHDNEKKEKVKLRIAQTLYLTGNFQQAMEEIKVSLKFSEKEKLNFLKIKAQVLVAQKKYKEALAEYEKILQADEKFFATENLFIAASVVYEENEEYAEALAYLDKYQEQIPDKAYLELRYKRLQERMVNKPLFKGRRK
ncbi:tetratricopeptide repeat protein [Pseudobdellovibrio exovorus]|nr:CDC27 family protein [Pseudobdellovibrio exovorus]